MLDKIDKHILRLIQDNGKITNSKLSNLVGISAPATLERVKRLERSGVISQFTALLNPEKIGYLTTAVVNINLSLSNPSSLEDAKEKFAGFEEVVECYQVAGATDFHLKVVTKDLKSYGDFMNDKLAMIKGIQSIKSSFIIDKVKESRSFFVDPEED
ncbi:MAG: Lrp/AsnC family transcriptional regulator [Halieaceae bacterium]|nr:Lrp/AsnC family transcriptional regulator [Halieaceae bacterium]